MRPLRHLKKAVVQRGKLTTLWSKTKGVMGGDCRYDGGDVTIQAPKEMATLLVDVSHQYSTVQFCS